MAISMLSFTSFLPAYGFAGKEARMARIDSTFDQAESQNLNTASKLRFEYFFSDIRKTFLEDFGERLKRDSFEIAGIYPKGDSWQLRISRNEKQSRKSVNHLEKKLRWLKFKFLIDRYDGFSIKPADIDPLQVPEDQFLTFVDTLSNDNLFWVANRLLYLKSYPRALVAFQETMDRNFKPDTTLYNFGTALVATHEYEKGIGLWEKSIELNPTYMEVYLQLGNILYENSHFKQALVNYKKADELSPNNDLVLYNIGETLYQLGRYNEALTYTKKAVRINHKNVFAKSLLKMLKHPSIRKEMKKHPGV